MHKKDMNHWLEIKQLLPAHVQLVAVSKYHSIEQIAEAYTAGCRDFGESRVQELRAKQEALPKDIRWHLSDTKYPTGDSCGCRGNEERILSRGISFSSNLTQRTPLSQHTHLRNYGYGYKHR